MIQKKFAWIPTIVRTWRPRGTKALVWMQSYYVNKQGKYINHLGFLSFEF